MALKRQQDMMATFSMASMTDVIFLLLVFFLVTSTFVFPTAVEVNLPEGVEQTAVKPGTRVYIDQSQSIYVSYSDGEPQQIAEGQLQSYLLTVKEQDPSTSVALYADESVPYGKVVEVLNSAAEVKLRMVLATKAAPSSARPDKSR
jgi:biopolymer transport protein ExbD